MDNAEKDYRAFGIDQRNNDDDDDSDGSDDDNYNSDAQIVDTTIKRVQKEQHGDMDGDIRSNIEGSFTGLIQIVGSYSRKKLVSFLLALYLGIFFLAPRSLPR